MPPLSFPAGTRGRFLRRRGAERNGTERRGASVPLRRGETSVQSHRKKSPLEEKHLSFSPSRRVLSYPADPVLRLSLFLRQPPPRDSFSSTSAGSFALCSKTLSLSLSLLSVLAPFVSDLLFQGLLPFCFCPSRGRDEQCNVIQVQE